MVNGVQVVAVTVTTQDSPLNEAVAPGITSHR